MHFTSPYTKHITAEATYITSLRAALADHTDSPAGKQLSNKEKAAALDVKIKASYTNTTHVVTAICFNAMIVMQLTHHCFIAGICKWR